MILKLKNNKYLLNFLWLSLFVLILLPFCTTIIFSVPYADDFSMALSPMQDNNIIANSFNIAVNFWFTWGGGIPFNFLQGCLNPLVLFGPNSYFYGLELVIFFLLFVVVLYFFIKVFLKYVFHVNSIFIIRFYYLLILFTFLNTMIYQEIFYWFVGNSYLWEVCFCLINQCFIIMYFRSEKTVLYGVLLSIVGFIACFAYQIAVFSGCLYIIEVYCAKRRGVKNIFIKLIPLLIMIAAGCISCFAPGNFSRHSFIELSKNSPSVGGGPGSVVNDMSSGGLHIGSALLYSISSFFDINIKLFIQPLFILLLFVGFLVGNRINSRTSDYINPLFTVLLLLISIYLTCFPVALGYSSALLENRIYFYINIFAVIGYVLNAVYLGIYLKNKEILLPLSKNYTICLSLAVLVFTFGALFQVCPNNKTYFENLPWSQTSSNIQKIITDSSRVKQTIKYIADSPEQDVVVKESAGNKQDNENMFISSLKLSEDKNHWINKDLAKYFHKNSVVLVK